MNIFFTLTVSCDFLNLAFLQLYTVFILQKRAIRTIFKIPSDQTCKRLFQDFNILTFPCIYILETLLFMRKIQNSTSTTKFKSLRQNLNIKITYHASTLYKKHITYNYIVLYNKLPNHLKNEENDSKFKKSLKRLLVENAFYSIKEYLNCDLE